MEALMSTSTSLPEPNIFISWVLNPWIAPSMNLRGVNIFPSPIRQLITNYTRCCLFESQIAPLTEVIIDGNSWLRSSGAEQSLTQSNPPMFCGREIRHYWKRGEKNRQEWSNLTTNKRTITFTLLPPVSCLSVAVEAGDQHGQWAVVMARQSPPWLHKCSRLESRQQVWHW